METYWIDFSKGINSIVDKAVTSDGYATALDNVDLRSGMPRPVLGPDKVKTANSNTVQIFAYRGRIIETPAPSDNRKYSYRDYVARMEDGSERIYWTEYGSYAQKLVDGVQANLGTIVPATPPYVSTGKSLIPQTVTLVNGLTNSGTLVDTESSYRVSAIVDEYIMPPTAPAVIKPQPNGSVTINWTGVENANGYIVWGRKYGLEEIIKRVPSGDILTYTDDGSASSEGDLASNYENKVPVSYAYSYVRDVGGMLDEGGLSFPSQLVSKSSSHLVTRNVALDGFFAQPGAQRFYDDRAYPGGAQVTGDHSISIAKTVTQITVDSVKYFTAGYVHFTCSAAHGLSTGDTVTFIDATNVALTQYQKYAVVYVSSTVFAITDMVQIPTSVTMPIHFIVNKAVVTVTSAPSTQISDGDVVWIEAKSTDGLTRMSKSYSAKYLTSTTFQIDEYIDRVIAVRYAGGEAWDAPTNTIWTNSIEIRHLAGNGMIKYWRLYRTGDSAQYLMVKELPITTSEYEDALPPTALGDTPGGFYTEAGVDVVFEPPPLGMEGLTEHLGMLFGIQGNRVRWTPVNRPDAWPENYTTSAFEHPPVALKGFNNALVILCQDKPYRLDGNNPSTLALSGTVSKDGCVAPYSVQIVGDKLVYLSSRGVVAFDGFNTVSLTSMRINPGFFFGGSAFSDGQAHKWFWQRTLDTHSYAKLAAPEITGFAANASALRASLSMDLPIREIGSFTMYGKYYLYWIRNEYTVSGYTYATFSAHTTMCIDFDMPGYPITTLGLQPLWVHVDELNRPYALVNYASGSGV